MGTRDAAEPGHLKTAACPPGVPPGVLVQALSLGGTGPAVVVKDSIDVAGVPTRLGSACLADAGAAVRHAHVVQRLLDAGCRIIGKSGLHELAFGVTGINAWSGTPPNPRAPGHIPGGSSSGSAVAVALGLADFALGNDTGGSIRIPSACCAVYGLKPTFGRVSREGAHPRHSTLDCVGPLAPDPDGLERAMSIIDPSFVAAPVPARAVIGWVETDADAEVIEDVRAALAASGAQLRPVRLAGLIAAYEAALVLVAAETFSAYGHFADGSCLGADVRARLLAAARVTAAEVAAAEAVRLTFRGEVDAALAGLDALALPTLPTPPPDLAAAADVRTALRLSAFVRPFNLTGHPALSIPVASRGLPVALQLVGAWGTDAALVALGRTVPPRA